MTFNKAGDHAFLSLTLTVIAGILTMVGSAVFLNNKFIHFANPQNLAVALSLSSGVMISISLMELQIEGIHTIINAIGTVEGNQHDVQHEDEHEHHNHGLNRNLLCNRTCEGKAYLICAFSFGCGCLIIFMLKAIVSKLCTSLPSSINVSDLEELSNNTRQSIEGSLNELHEHSQSISPISVAYLEEQPSPISSKLDKTKREQINKTSLMAVLFLWFNNIPNGVAIYLATISDVHLGIVLTLAVVLYNVPEGICIATPIFYASGNRMKSFIWTLPIAFATPIGGVTVYGILGNRRGSIAEGVMFAIVAGMMVTNCIQELLPTARRFARNKDYVTYSFISGIVLIMILIASFVYIGF